jgi:hypothetical protein
LITIAEHRLLDAIKSHSRKKRGGDRQRVGQQWQLENREDF